MIPQISVSILLLTKMLEKRYLRKRSIDPIDNFAIFLDIEI